jgi:hypothetical protein
MATFVQRNQVTLNADTTVAFDSNVTAGSTLFVALRVSDHNITISSITSGVNGGASYTQVGSQFTDASTQQRVALYRYSGTAAGAETVTITRSTNDTTRVIILEYSGLTTSGDPLDQTNNSGFVAATTTVNSGDVTTTQANELILGLISGNAGGVAFTAGTNFTDRTETASNRLFVEERIVSSTGTYAATGTMGSADAHIAIVYAFKDSGGAGTPSMGYISSHLRPNAFAPGFGR